ncbi:VOC family protein [Pseudaestuariivita rosea]|uniref:VOC family protein n=1 Tax=Pseudaestuariivita rosea TaxID=2763263 RepID=UPI001ABA85D9|nr:VOC family protein [Pseudaestuariivita rosea]
MAQFIHAVSLVVPDYDQAIEFYVGTMDFDLIQDTVLSPDKRWVLVAPPGSGQTRLLLAKAAGDAQNQAIGNQTGGRVFLFLHSDDFDRDYERLSQAGVTFLEDPRHEPYGTVVVFQDPFGNKWDLLQLNS